jgi:hypothetical protein
MSLKGCSHWQLVQIFDPHIYLQICQFAMKAGKTIFQAVDDKSRLVAGPQK